MKLLFLALFALWPAATLAHQDGEPNAAWYQSLIQPGSNGSCCNMEDCRPVVARSVGPKYEVFDSVEKEWLEVPDHYILHRDNPTGEPVACILHHHVICFVRGPET